MSTLFGLIGVIGKDGVGVVNILISEENLNAKAPVLLKERESIDMIYECLYGNGDLHHVLYGDEGEGSESDNGGNEGGFDGIEEETPTEEPVEKSINKSMLFI